MFLDLCDRLVDGDGKGQSWRVPLGKDRPSVRPLITQSPGSWGQVRSLLCGSQLGGTTGASVVPRETLGLPDPRSNRARK